MRASPSHSAFQVLRLIIHGPTGAANPDIVLLDYRDPDTFKALWLEGLESGSVTVGGQQISLKDPAKRFLLVGNDLPDGVFDTKLPGLTGINFRGHFTATSWLAAWKVKFPTAQVSIAVIDPRESRHAHGTARALQALFGAKGAEDRRLVPGAAVLNAPSLSGICQWLAAAKEDQRTLSNDAPHLRDLLKSTIWNELSSNREQHHALSNVLGAFLLRPQMGGKKADGGIQMLQGLLDALVKVCGVGTSGQGGVQAWAEKDLRKEFDGAVLIDDMADLWEGFLGAAFGGENRNLVRTTATGKFNNAIEGAKPTPDDGSLTGLPKRLNDFLTSGRPQLTSEDLIGLSGDQQAPGPWENFVLFLDLRLGLGERFQKQLAQVATTMLASKSRNLPWLTKANRTKFEEGLRDGKIDETLLPRIISLLDPTLPIVIFSSTHRTELIDPFRDYGNIITAFRKPILSGMTRSWAETVNELRADFVSAVEQAKRISRVRCAFAKLKSCRIEEVTTGANAIEVFIDESYYQETNLYAIGSIILLADSHQSIRKFCQAMEDKNLRWGLSRNNRDSHIRETRRLVWNGKRLECARGWFVDRKSLPAAGLFLKKFASDAEQVSAWESIQELASKNGVTMFSATLAAEVTDQIGRELGIPSLQGVARDQADELHRELAKTLLLVLFTAHPVLSAALRGENASIAVDVGTRTAVPNNYENRYEETYQSFGLGYTDHTLGNPDLEERRSMWNMAIDWARSQDWWDQGDTVARIARNRITPDEADLSRWTDTMIWDPRRKMISVTSYDGLNYLREVLARLSASLSPHIVRARGCALFDFEDRSDWMVKLHSFPCFPYQPHYLADWIARCGVQQPGDHTALGDAFASGFRAIWDSSKKDLLNAVLDMDKGDNLEGLKALVCWLEQHGAPSECRATELLLSRAHEVVVKADGSILRGLFASIC